MCLNLFTNFQVNLLCGENGTSQIYVRIMVPPEEYTPRGVSLFFMFYLAAIATVYRTMSVGQSVCLSVGR